MTRLVISTDVNYDVYVGNVTFASPRRCKGRGSFPEGSIESANSFAERGNDRSVPQRFPGVFAVTALAGTHWPHAGARDHYALCVGPYGNFSAHPVLTRTNRIDLKSRTRLPIRGKEMRAAKEGEVSDVSCVSTRSDYTTPVEQDAFVTKIGDQSSG